MSTTEARCLSVTIERTASDVYDYVANPANVPNWAAGLAGSISEEHGVWFADSPMGRIVIEFVERNGLGVLDHHVTMADGTRFYNPMRVTANGDGCDVAFTLHRSPEMDDAAFVADAALVQADLETLKRLLEA